jgi:hypothetical protein
MQTTDLALIWLVAMVTAFVILLLKLAAVALVAYVAWRAVAVVRRVGLKSFGRALGLFMVDVVQAVAKLFTREGIGTTSKPSDVDFVDIYDDLRTAQKTRERTHASSSFHESVGDCSNY